MLITAEALWRCRKYRQAAVTVDESKDGKEGERERERERGIEGAKKERGRDVCRPHVPRVNWMCSKGFSDINSDLGAEPPRRSSDRLSKSWWVGSCTDMHIHTQTHHSELLQFLVALDEEGTLLVACPVPVAFTSPACRHRKRGKHLIFFLGLLYKEKYTKNENILFLFFNKVRGTTRGRHKLLIAQGEMCIIIAAKLHSAKKMNNYIDWGSGNNKKKKICRYEEKNKSKIFRNHTQWEIIFPLNLYTRLS